MVGRRTTVDVHGEKQRLCENVRFDLGFVDDLRIGECAEGHPCEQPTILLHHSTVLADRRSERTELADERRLSLHLECHRLDANRRGGIAIERSEISSRLLSRST